MSDQLTAWLQSAKYLPKPLRDFHDAKAVFKAMHEIVREDPDALVKRPDWVAGHCYVIDCFLWFMARRGYTLQKTRKRLPFRDLEADVAEQTALRSGHFASLLNQALPPTALTPPHPTQEKT